ncbi:MAG: N-formylglutamate amidohydrolase [Rhodospirillales bacterium]|nr:N-formylglutamate amidohydrolase [Rhodospirillales bacterium]MBO6788584.1 N-formylglutamate amidohydrolase [Rhodospirillales bacterium]
MDERAPVVVVRPAPDVQELPLVYDSPHSGNDFPADMNAAVPVSVLRRNEDAFVDALFGHVTALGAVLVKATFPRTYCDANRSEQDVDPGVLDGDWDLPAAPSEKLIRRGAGVVPVKVHGITDIYDRRLTAKEVKYRLDTCWRPYHRAVETELDRLYESYGGVWHINCHSTRARGNKTDPDGEADRADFILGNWDGTTCSAEFLALVEDFLSARGCSVDVNWPMKGVELVRRYSDPGANRHSLQIELNRKNYMDEARIEKNEHYAVTEALLADMNAVIANYVKSRSQV